jgi:murein L,D-transpeptidase YcbB/YkuD
MNITVHERIRQDNMERSRWLSHDYTKAKQSIVVNIPSFTLTYFKESKPVFVSRVVVGKSMNKTAVFSGQMNQIVFSPY